MYPLHVLFDIRERAKKDSEEAYAKEKHKLTEEEKKLREMQEELARMRSIRRQKRAEYFEAMSSGELKIEAIKMGYRHLEKLLDDETQFGVKIEEQKQVVFAAQKRVKEALDVMMKATQEFNVLEKHKEKWLTKQRKAREKKEEEAADDLTQTRYNLQLKEAEGK